MKKLIVSTLKKSIFNKTIEIKITESQYEQIKEMGGYPFLHTRSLPEGGVTFTPSVRLSNKKIVHIGQVFFPDNERMWDKSIWIKEKWNFSLENVLVDTKTQFHCVYHDNREGGLGLYVDKSKRMCYNRCKECHFKYELIRYARGRARKKKLLDDLVRNTEVAMKWIHRQEARCAVTKVVLTFHSHSGLYMASLDQIVSNRGYTEKNTRLVCHGFNQLKKQFSDKEVKEFLMAYGSGRPLQDRIKFTGEFRRKINDMIHTCNRMDTKRGFGPINLTVEDVEELIWETRGMCPSQFCFYFKLLVYA